MNTKLKQILIDQIDNSVNKGYFETEEQAVAKAMGAIREEEIMARIELGQQQVREGKTSPFKGTAKQVIAELKAKLAAQAS
ncbi:MAG: hypothetical protein GKR95_20415 [Gammaproteobacteria bacterium]|nr:hypothetical protein [Gammaproteobacteria bacterium]NKB64374.1 hypothetical protein [Gammaproteobacteria bacterium]